MKIIKSGTKTPPNKQVYVIKCRTCGCVFTYKLEDMRYIMVDTLGIYCPECGYSNVPIIKKKYKGGKMKLEVWKDIENHPNYQISNFGNVKSKERYTKAKDNMIIHRKEKLLKQLIDSKGYLYVRLYNKNGFKNIKVHRLVAQTFIPNINNEPTIDHIDRNKKNNKINNLRWASNVVQANNKNKTNIIEHMRKLGKSKKALLKRWHPEQFEQMAYKVGDE